MTQEISHPSKPKPPTPIFNKMQKYNCFVFVIMGIVGLLAPFLWPSLILPSSVSNLWFWKGTLAEVARDAWPYFLVSSSMILINFIVNHKRIESYLDDLDLKPLPRAVRPMLPLRRLGLKPKVYDSTTYDPLLRDPFLIFYNSIWKCLLGVVFAWWFFFYFSCAFYSFFNIISFDLFRQLYLSVFRGLGDIVTFSLLHSVFYQGPWVLGALIVVPLNSLLFLRRISLQGFFVWVLFWWSGMLYDVVLLRHGIYAVLLIGILQLTFTQLLVSFLFKPSKRLQQQDIIDLTKGDKNEMQNESGGGDREVDTSEIQS